MKFLDLSFNVLKVTVGTKSVTNPRMHARTHAPKAICPINFFKVGGIMMLQLLQLHVSVLLQLQLSVAAVGVISDAALQLSVLLQLYLSLMLHNVSA